MVDERTLCTPNAFTHIEVAKISHLGIAVSSIHAMGATPYTSEKACPVSVASL